MNDKKLEQISREAEQISNCKPGTLCIEDIQRCIDGNGLISHPVDNAIMSLLEKIKK